MSVLAKPQPASETRIAARAASASKVYGSGEAAVRALDDVNVAFEAGRFTAIMGPSGSGKSTLMHCLAGLDTVDSGAIHIGQTEITKLNDKDLDRKSTRLNSSHGYISYAVFCLKKKKPISLQ